MQKENDWKVFYNNVKSRCGKLIEYGIWQGIDIYQFKAWLNNFQTERAQFFSALILDSMIFRSEEHVKSMLYDLLTRNLHNMWRLKKDSLYDANNNPLDLLKSRYPKIGFRIVTTVKGTDPVTKSGFHMVHLLNHQMNVRCEWIIKTDEINYYYNQGIHCFLLLDDIACTGEQIEDILNEIDITKYPEARFYIALCTIHEKALTILKEHFPSINIVYTEFLDNKNNFFESIPINETDYKNKQDAIDKYTIFLKKHNIIFKPPLGKGNLGLTYAFSHNVPNNSLPILHYENEQFKKLINKRP